MIPAQLSAAFASLAPELKALQNRVDAILEKLAEDHGGYYVSRVKAVGSLFEKLMLGRVQRLSEIDDLVGGTIVFPRVLGEADQVSMKEALLQRFEIIETRTARTRRPTEFIYDDLHHLIRLKDDNLLIEKELAKWVIELQIKSALQHGWTQATHDAVYKAKDESWRASRVAAATKAMIETADFALSRPGDFMPVAYDREYKPIDERRALVAALEGWWQGDIPSDRRRVGLFVADMIGLAQVSVEEFRELLSTTRATELAQLKSITVQQAVTILLLETRREQLLMNVRRKHRFVVVTSEMRDIAPACTEVPEDLLVVIDA
ncbi:MAG TPA: hypothetical protein VH061_02175 [Solirubrobacteraceae bacterium]|jgi:ppGpp synthetase/RelA/SpoT-type nucleotidyltranferase|nr:hypothetical protein [Solirubrobacteraceae bacterium]